MSHCGVFESVPTQHLCYLPRICPDLIYAQNKDKRCYSPQKIGPLHGIKKMKLALQTLLFIYPILWCAQISKHDTNCQVSESIHGLFFWFIRTEFGIQFLYLINSLSAYHIRSPRDSSGALLSVASN